VPAGYHLEERPRKGLVIAGSVVLGTTYFLSAAIGMASTNTGDRWLLVPVFGPFLDLGARGSDSCTTSSSARTCDALETVVRFYLALDGVVQGSGALLLISGFVFPKKEFVSDSYYGRTRGPGVAWWTVTPDVTSSRVGLTLRGGLF
jgi:hypothetical protein